MPSRAYGGYACQKPSSPRKSGRPESTPIPAPAHTSSAPASEISSAARSSSSLTRLTCLHYLELQEARAARNGLRALTGVRFARGAGCPSLVGLFGLPLRVHEVALVTGNRTQQLEAEETGLSVDRVQPGGEPLLQLGSGAFGNFDRVDLHHCHGPSLLIL